MWSRTGQKKSTAAASATIYRDAQDRPQDEHTGEIGSGFSVQVCQRRENAFFEQRTPFTREVALRTAITLGEGGVLVPYRQFDQRLKIFYNNRAFFDASKWRASRTNRVRNL